MPNPWIAQYSVTVVKFYVRRLSACDARFIGIFAVIPGGGTFAAKCTDSAMGGLVFVGAKFYGTRWACC